METKKDKSTATDRKESAVTNHRMPIKINVFFQMPTVEVTETPSNRKHYCACCGKSYTRQDGNFLKNSYSILWQGNNGYLPVCKPCCDTIYNALINFFSGNEEHALQRWCAIFDYPYHPETSAAAVPKEGQSKCCLYPSRMNTPAAQLRGKTYLDTIRNEAGVTGRMDNDVVRNEYGDDEAVFVVTRAMIKKWGHGLDTTEYQWLEEQEEDWRARTECKTKPQEELIRALCMSQLNLQKAQHGGGKVAEAAKTFQDLLATCNLQPRQAVSDISAEQEPYGELIRKFETTRPAPDADPEWEDVDGIKKYVDTWFLGHLCNLVHLNNDNQKAYEEEVAKYTVKPPTYDDDGEDIDVSLLDKYSTKADKDEDGDGDDAEE